VKVGKLKPVNKEFSWKVTIFLVALLPNLLKAELEPPDNGNATSIGISCPCPIVSVGETGGCLESATVGFNIKLKETS